MPLHLLPKKSWNVYNSDNIEKVKQDEALAAARQEAEEQRTLEEDAERRIRILRGDDQDLAPERSRLARGLDHSREQPNQEARHKARRRCGEDDTERDMRLAEEARKRQRLQLSGPRQQTPRCDAPLIDGNGHISLFPEAATVSQGQGPETTKTARSGKDRDNDTGTLRFSSARGIREDVKKDPWYLSQVEPTADERRLSNAKDVRQNESPSHQSRQKAALASDDPLAAMRRGAKAIRQGRREREQLKASRISGDHGAGRKRTHNDVTARCDQKIIEDPYDTSHKPRGKRIREH